MILFPLLNRLSKTGLVIGAVAIALLGIPVQRIFADTALLLPLGIMYDEFVSADYYPLVPYLSIFMLGVLAFKNALLQTSQPFSSSALKTATSP